MMKLDATFFRHNRDALSRQLSGGLIVLAGHRAMQLTNDMAAPFRQEANFWYLSGVESADWHLIIDGTRGKSWLVAPQLSEMQQIFDGGLAWEDAIKRSGVNEVVPQKDFDSLLRDLARHHSLVYSLASEHHTQFVQNPGVTELRERLERTFGIVRDCRKELAGLRAIKQPAEIVAIKRAVRLTVDTFQEVHSHLDDGKYEYELEAEFSYAFARKHAIHAYDPIVASGKNACTLHYTANGEALRRKQMVLLDVGAYVDGYAADITRTYAVGEVSTRAKQIHEALQVAQAEIISLLGPDVAVNDYIESVDAIMMQTLFDLKLIKDAQDSEGYRQIMPHAISHGLGIDVHDSLGAPKFFSQGMVLTVEPGIYLPEMKLGIRIEDDILITDRGRENLSKSLLTHW